MKRSRLLFLLPSLLLASCWQRETVHSSSEPSGVESVFTYAFHESPDQQDSLLGLWDLGYFSNAISSAFPLKDKKDFYFAGDVISIRSSEPLLTQETFPATHILPEGAEIYSVSIRSARIEEIPVAELTETKEGKYVYRGEEVLSSNVVLSRTLQYAPFLPIQRRPSTRVLRRQAGRAKAKRSPGFTHSTPGGSTTKTPPISPR